MKLNSYYIDHPCGVCRAPVFKLLHIGAHIEREKGKIVKVSGSQLREYQMTRLQELEYPTCTCRV